MAERGAHLNFQTHENVVRPSVFDILSQETLMHGLKPAAKYTFKFLSVMYPHSFRTVVRHFDEFYAGFELLLQNYFLKAYDSSFAENFYGLKRIAAATGIKISFSHRLRSLIILVLVPYVKGKLDILYERMKNKETRKLFFRGARLKMADLFVAMYPKICATFEFWTLFLQVGYIVSKSDVHSPWLKLAGVRLTNLSPSDVFTASGTASPNGIFGRFGSLTNNLFAWLCKMLGLGLYFVQFLDWMQSNEQLDKMSFAQLPVPKAPQEVLVENNVVKMDPQLCPLCRTKRKNDTVLAISGYVFCYSCIFNHIQRRKCCPVTKIPAGTEHLIRLYINPNGVV